jgi:hypothetical protein
VHPPTTEEVESGLLRPGGRKDLADGDRSHVLSSRGRSCSTGLGFLLKTPTRPKCPDRLVLRGIQQPVHPLFAESLDGVPDEAIVVPLPFTAG